MDAISKELLKRLKLEDAIAAEAASWQNSLPPMPGWAQLANQPAPLAKWIEGQLLKGMPVAPGTVLAAKKYPHGIRPVPIWGPAERIVYRALTTFILRNQSELDRSPEAYLKFVGGPLEFARNEHVLDPVTVLLVGASSVKYVVKSDVVSFYDYVDHALLGDELLAMEGDFEAVEGLLSLLRESQGRTFGLPQMLDPSDRLSEVYIDRVERAMVRRGWPVWRFNDDFRVAVGSFSDAQGAIEDLAAVARDHGLTLSDFKTTTPKFSTYSWDTFGLAVDSELPDELANHEPEDFVGDYTEGVGAEENDWALAVLENTHVEDVDGGGDDLVVLSGLTTAGFRRLRRALSRLIRDSGPEVPEILIPIVAFVPALTPWVMRLVVSSAQADEVGAAEVVRKIATDGHLNDWQRTWILRTIGDLLLLDGTAGHVAELREWVEKLLRDRLSPAVAAEAAFALAKSNLIDFESLERELASQPAALAPFYLAAVRELAAHGNVTAKQLKSASVGGKLTQTLLTP